MSDDIYHYTYIIKFQSINKWYYGVRTCKSILPENDLGKLYFSSSNIVNTLIEKGLEASFHIHKIFDTRLEANDYEEKILRKLKGMNKHGNMINKCFSMKSISPENKKIYTHKKSLRVVHYDSESKVDLSEYTKGVNYKARKEFLEYVCSTINPIEWYDNDRIRLITNSVRKGGMRKYLPDDIDYVYNIMKYNQDKYNFFYRFVSGKELDRLSSEKVSLLENSRFLKIIGWYDSINFVVEHYKSEIKRLSTETKLKFDHKIIEDLIFKKRKLKECGEQYGVTESRMCQVLNVIRKKIKNPNIKIIRLRVKIYDVIYGRDIKVDIKVGIKVGIKVSTPWGKFNSYSKAYSNKPSTILLSFKTMREWIKTNRKKVSLQSYKASSYLQSLGRDVIGKSYRSLGFYKIT